VSLPPDARRQQITYGDYYIFEWSHPTAKFNNNIKLSNDDYIAAFKTKDFIVNDKAKGIRRSDELN